MSEADPQLTVAEVQGLYGPFTFSERLLQKIWDRGDFDEQRLVTPDGRPVVVVDRGRWNGLAGPDFLQARIRVGDTFKTGDVELHLYVEDWVAHRHAKDPAYRDVCLHVVLFPPVAAHQTIGGDGGVIPVVALLPVLRHDLEEYAAEDAVELMANRGCDQLRERLRESTPAQIHERVVQGAMRRWQRKVHFAKLRIERLGLAEACHQTAMEVLGYRFNRVPMLNLAARHPLAKWSAVSPEAIEVMLIEEHANWARGGVRPANQPRRRLQQYAQWVGACPAWPAELLKAGARWPRVDLNAATRSARSSAGLSVIKLYIADHLCGGALGGTRLDTMICDAMLPLVSAASGRDLAGLWWHWWPGDWPGFAEAARAEVGRVMSPFCQGAVQGLIDWGLELEGLAT
ncbi:MAG: DUF2851 family protein [Opitutaceae bacterium]|nr:DUF2851 family protein [Opitutaceae bacterium]